MGGVKKLLSADDDRESYSLGKLNDELLCEEFLSANGMCYESTDIRVEKVTFPNIALLKNIKEPTLVIFTHEWAMNKVNSLKLEYLIWRLSFENIEYVN